MSSRCALSGLAIVCMGVAGAPRVAPSGESPEAATAHPDGASDEREALAWPERIARERALAEHAPEHQPRSRDGAPTFRGGVRFDGRGARLAGDDRPGGELTIGLVELGRPGAMRAVATGVAPEVAGAEVRIERAVGVVEWWRDLPSGLEQGVTIAARAPGDGPLRLEMTTGDEVRPEQASDDAIVLRAPTGEALARYEHLVVLDAAGGRVPARLAVSGARIRIEVDDDLARYPIVVDPLLRVVEEATLVPALGASSEDFGYSVALSADGIRAIVGAVFADTVGGADAGSARVFVRNGSSWVEEATLVATGGAAGDWFGGSVALSADGVRAIVGASGDDTVGGVDAGSARVFRRTGSTWVEEATLLGSGGAANHRLGWSVGLSADGGSAIVGTPIDGLATSGGGSARLFLRSGTSWAEAAALVASDAGAFDQLGRAVALSADGSRALVGAPYDDVAGGTDAGSARVFVRQGTSWLEEASLSSITGASGDHFGASVALNVDGTRALVGAPEDDTADGADAGSARVFLRSGTTWADEALLLAAGGAPGDAFGSQVALSADASRALVGAATDDTVRGADAGSARAFVRTGASWSEDATLVASDGAASDRLGTSVALGADGSLALVGAPEDDIATLANAGTARTFLWSGGTWSGGPALVASGGSAAEFFGFSVALSADGARALVGATRTDVAGAVDAGSARAFLRTSAGWVEEATLVSSGSVAGDNLGVAVALSGDGSRALVGAYHADTAGGPDAGCAYVFVRTLTTWVEEARLVATDGSAQDLFGGSVALTADGARALVGARDHTTMGRTGAGSAYVFVRTGTTWVEEVQLVASDGDVGDELGYAVALDADATRAIVGAPSHATAGGAACGSAYTFIRTGTTWVEEANLSASDGASGDELGHAVALSADGSRALVGAHSDDTVGGLDAGSSRVFLRTGTSWAEEAVLLASGGTASDWFGFSVGLSDDGLRAFIGMPRDDIPALDAGSVRVLLRTGTTWTEDQTVLGWGGAAGDFFGRAVALSADGTRGIAGATLDATPAGASAGTARIFSMTPRVANGEPCDAADACIGELCVDGVCCDTACGGSALDCQACASAMTGIPSGTCAPLAASVAPSVTCRAAAAACDLTEVCGATSPTCPPDALAPATSVCRPPAMGMACDAPETCSGTSAACPADVPAATATVCRAPAGSCDAEERCDGTSRACPGDARLPSGVSCRPPAGPCDVPEACDGSSAGCPTDDFATAAVVCRVGSGPCDVDDRCSGTSALCVNLFATGTTCRPAVAACDVADVCDGTSASCPLDAVLSAGTECAPSSGEACDAPDHCNGATADCPAEFLGGVECRASTGICDPGEVCAGSSASCPPDAIMPSGTSCRRSTDTACDPEETCDGVAAACPTDITRCAAIDAGAIDSGAADAGVRRDSGGLADTSPRDAGGPVGPVVLDHCGCQAVGLGASFSGLRLVGFVLLGLLARTRARRAAVLRKSASPRSSAPSRAAMRRA